MKKIYFSALLTSLLFLSIPFGKLAAQSDNSGMPSVPSDQDPATMKIYEAKKLRWSLSHPEEYKAMQESKTAAQGDKYAAPPSYPKFLSYPTSRQMPRKIDSGNASEDQLLYELRLQHWYFLFDQAGYVAKYGPLPTELPGGISAKDYAKNPPMRAISSDLEAKFAEMQAAESQPSTEE